MRTAPHAIVVTLASGSLLVMAEGSNYEVVSQLPYPEEGDAQGALESIRVQADMLRASINRLRALHGKDPIT